MINWIIEKLHYRKWSKDNDKKMKEENERYCQIHFPLWHHRLHNHGASYDLGVVIGDKTLERFKGYKIIKEIEK